MKLHHAERHQTGAYKHANTNSKRLPYRRHRSRQTGKSLPANRLELVGIQVRILYQIGARGEIRPRNLYVRAARI